MRHVICPKCKTRYRIPDNIVNCASRRMRCSKCENVFVLQSEQDIQSDVCELVQASDPLLTAKAPIAKGGTPYQIDEDAETTMYVPEKHDHLLAHYGMDVAFEDDDLFNLDTSCREPGDTPRSHFLGKFMFGFSLTIVVFFLFMFYLSGWTFSFDRLDERVAAFFSGELRPKMAMELEGLEVTLTESHLVFSELEASKLVATGLVFNNTPFRKSHIVLRGTLYDKNGNLLKQLDFPCGAKFESELFGQIQAAGMGAFDLDKNSLPNCVIGPDGVKKYHLILRLPSDYSNGSRLDVQPVSAKISR